MDGIVSPIRYTEQRAHRNPSWKWLIIQNPFENRRRFSFRYSECNWFDDISISKHTVTRNGMLQLQTKLIGLPKSHVGGKHNLEEFKSSKIGDNPNKTVLKMASSLQKKYRQ